jgi:hypothetical protein
MEWLAVELRRNGPRICVLIITQGGCPLTGRVLFYPTVTLRQGLPFAEWGPMLEGLNNMGCRLHGG